MAQDGKEKLAAGGVVIEAIDDRAIRVLLVHRPRYGDWSFPKGGVDEGESIEDAALREVFEETGLKCRIVRKLAEARYRYRTRRGAVRPKAVHYFLMEPVGGQIATDGEEIDSAEWFDTADAEKMLSYDLDKEILKTLVDSF
jgi:8-oxo-dGTP pyrophosphatase MutT (NUDIX family)